MNLTFEIAGPSCDLALHPISEKTAQRIREQGRDIYKQKYLSWWRKGNTATYGMRFGDDSNVRVLTNDTPVKFDESLITRDVIEIRRRLYLNSKAKFLAVLGFDDEYCKFQWMWHDVKDFDPTLFSFSVQRWDRVMGEPNYFVIDNVMYDGRWADEEDWCDPSGFTLIDPIVIDLKTVRQDVEREQRAKN
ncbi:hypothetical protein GGQ74_002294 [Desulfobaculum xiamenense]|uniref:Uncharacterized protein n=1 Tax=Desulfobaculum xiamenense TaxID=995050 RepID=A0A846QKG1_9BACT|nr:hypothetical protein [Desulfobaculum xiamenense]NJB68621.1 hypothetical protein [Desulfobaculum xiamenense]